MDKEKLREIKQRLESPKNMGHGSMHQIYRDLYKEDVIEIIEAILAPDENK